MRKIEVHLFNLVLVLVLFEQGLCFLRALHCHHRLDLRLQISDLLVLLLVAFLELHGHLSLLHQTLLVLEEVTLLLRQFF